MAKNDIITNSGDAAIYFMEELCRYEDEPVSLYPYQKEFLKDESTYRIVNKARQLGFSFIIACEAVFEALTNPNYTVLIVSTGESGAKRVLSYCYKIIYGLKFKVNFTKSTQEEFGFPNGSSIVSLPNNPSTVRGFKADRVYIDEAAHFLKDKEIFQAIQPSISRGGKLTLSSTPHGRANIFFDKWTNDSEYSKHIVDYTLCPDTKYQKSVKKQRKTMSEFDFRQEYCCDFMADDMAMFPKELLEACVDNKLQNMYHPETMNSFFMGIDFGKQVDSTVITVVELTKEKKIITRHIKELRRMPYETDDPNLPSQMLEITRLFRMFRIQRIKMDSTGVGVKLEEDLIRKFGHIVEGVRFGSQEKEALITNLRVAFERKGLIIPDNEKLISQLMSLEKSTTPSGMARYTHISGKNDDYVWSMALAVSAATLSSIDMLYNFVGESESHKVNEEVFEDKQSIVAW